MYLNAFEIKWMCTAKASLLSSACYNIPTCLQLADFGEQNKKLEDQLKKVQARLENLQVSEKDVTLCIDGVEDRHVQISFFFNRESMTTPWLIKDGQMCVLNLN